MRTRTHVFFFAVFVCVTVALAPRVAFAATHVTSDVTTDTHWTIVGSPYEVHFDNGQFFPHLLTIAPTATLTIDPGVVVKFDTYNGIVINGTLHAEGTANNPIIFTSIKDDAAGGDTNGDEDSTTPVDEDWMYLQFNSGSSGSIAHATVRYGGQYATPVPMTGIENDGGTLTLDYVTFTHNGFDGFGQWAGDARISHSHLSDHEVGIAMGGGRLEVSDTHIDDNSWAGIHQMGGTLSVTGSEIDHNGMGVFVEYNSGSVTISNSSIHDNADTAGDSFGIHNELPDITVDARNNWWGDASGPNDLSNNPSGTGDGVYGDVAYTPWLTSDPLAPLDPCATPGTCVSNVLFLPGIEGSRLYEGTVCGKSAEEKLWEPDSSYGDIFRGVGDGKVGELALNAAGESECPDIYTKEGDIIDTTLSGNLYQSLIGEMNGLKESGTMNAWEPVSYDWRLSLHDLMHKGAEHGGKIYYEQATSTPYIEQTLRALAASSKTGKVTIIAHSNGGLVAKALLKELGGIEAARLVDKVIMVAAPQSGAPADIGSLLVGYNAGIYSHGIPIVSNKAARTFAQNSPMAYHLLPSENYLESTASDTAHPVIRFSGDGYTKEEAAYGATITNLSSLDSFLLAKEGGRVDPFDPNDLKAAEILSPTLIDYANGEHDALDSWAPPASIEVDQIAGWGVDTVQGIDFYSQWSLFGPMREYRPIPIEDGDGTVPVPSALMMASSTNVKRYFVNLAKVNNIPGTEIEYTHGNILEMPELQDFIKNILGNSTSTLPLYISSTQPASQEADKKLTFFLHSPLTLQVTDASGNVTGIAQDGSVSENIPGSSYEEFGEVKYVAVPEGNAYHLVMHGQENGTFSLDVQESSGDIVTSVSTIADVPTTPNTLASLTVPGGADTLSPLSIDENGDGHILTITPNIGGTTFFDTIPPEANIGFSTSTKNIVITGSDNLSTTTLMATATSTTITDLAGNALTLAITRDINRPNRTELIIPSFKYSIGTTTNATTSLRYFWATDKKNKYALFISAIKTPTERLIAIYVPRLDKTYVVSSTPGDDVDDLSARVTLLLLRKRVKTYDGLYIPSVTTKQGSMQIN